MSDPLVSIILRSFNEGWALRETLPALRAQEYKHWELIVIDSGSTDGSVELIQQATPRHLIQIQPEAYNPSRVMNLGMQLARSEFGIFLNADATPQGPGWLRPLAAALQDRKVAAVFGKQIPRPDCRAVYAHDYERCFGPKRESRRWDHFFSMASSGIRKDVWAQRGFLEKMQYSEDDEYTRWCREQGFHVVYVPESVVMHSHNYTPQQAYRRSFGEARALAAVWAGRPGAINWPRTVFFGWLNDARRDLRFCARRNCLRDWPHAVRIRWEQRRARLSGFREGWKFYRNGHASETPDLGPAHFDNVGDSVNPLSSRFTLDGSPALERHLAQVCHRVLAGVRSIIPEKDLEALVLGGGYGRGQGGVLKTQASDLPYNDLEFYVYLRGNRFSNQRLYDHPLQMLGETLSPTAGLHVEFKVDSLEHLRDSPVSMFSYDLLSGHRLLWPKSGAQSEIFAGCEHHLDAETIPVHEATRLLLNRCTGLLLAKALLRHGPLADEDADFVGRNLAKAQLALGDAVLVAFQRYHWSCIQRHLRLEQLVLNPSATGEEPALHPGPWLQEVLHHHATGTEFKLHPQRISRSLAEFQQEHRAISTLALEVWLWLENRRLNQRFLSPHHYSFNPVRKCPDTPSWRNRLVNARAFGLKAAFGRMSGYYPRERLLNALPLLLWEEPLNDLRVRRQLQNQLRTTASDWQSFVKAYTAIWPRFS